MSKHVKKEAFSGLMRYLLYGKDYSNLDSLKKDPNLRKKVARLNATFDKIEKHLLMKKN